MVSETPTLTPLRLRVLRFVAERCIGGLPPTRAEIASHVGVTTRNGDHLVALQRLGLLEINPGAARGSQPTEAGWSVLGLRSRPAMLEAIYRAADRWERGTGSVTDLLDAVLELREREMPAATQEVA